MKLLVRYLSANLLWLSYILFFTGNAWASAGKPRELVVVRQQIWVLAENGRIQVYDANGTKQHLPSVDAVKAEHLAEDGSNVIAQIGPTIQRWNMDAGTWQTVGKLTNNVFALLVTSQHTVFAISSAGVLDIATGKTKLPAYSPNNQLQKFNSFGRPSAYFIDGQDNIWIGFGYGEWGGNIFVFNTHQHKFINLIFNEFKIELNPIKSFYQFNTQVGISCGLQHFFNSGTIAAFQDFKAHVVFRSDTEIDTSTRESRWQSARSRLYIGPAVYEAQSEQLYFYSSQGVFKGSINNDLSKQRNWQLLFTPKLHWQNGQPDAVGSPMNVLSMLSLGEGKLVLLTQNDGIGIWNGSTFKLLP